MAEIFRLYDFERAMHQRKDASYMHFELIMLYWMVRYYEGLKGRLSIIEGGLELSPFHDFSFRRVGWSSGGSGRPSGEPNADGIGTKRGMAEAPKREQGRTEEAG
jgi:hypothetical protein